MTKCSNKLSSVSDEREKKGEFELAIGGKQIEICDRVFHNTTTTKNKEWVAFNTFCDHAEEHERQPYL